MQIHYNNELTLSIIKEQVEKMKTRDKELKKIILEHPEIILAEDAPDTELLYYIMKIKKVNTDMSVKEFKKGIPPLSTIRNFRQKIIKELKKQGIFLENSDRMQEKDAFIKEKYMNDRM